MILSNILGRSIQTTLYRSYTPTGWHGYQVDNEDNHIAEPTMKHIMSSP